MLIDIIKDVTYNNTIDYIFHCSGMGVCGFSCLPTGNIDSITVSVWAKSSIDKECTFFIFGQYFIEEVTDNWQRLIFKVVNPMFREDNFNIQIEKRYYGTLQLYKMMVEVNADVPSDWKAAPEDTDDKIIESYQLVQNAKMWFSFEDSGFIVQKANSKWRTRTSDDGFYIEFEERTEPIGAFRQDALEVYNLCVGKNNTDIMSKHTSSGGWVWTDRGGE